MWSPAEVLRDWIRCPEKVTILMDSIRSLSGVHQDSLIVYTGCYIERVQMDSSRTPDTVSGVYLDLWLSVMTSLSSPFFLHHSSELRSRF